ncbi:hypothetical protein CRYUN_Cryun01aG0199000 [Craigia yunnanensis]
MGEQDNKAGKKIRGSSRGSFANQGPKLHFITAVFIEIKTLFMITRVSTTLFISFSAMARQVPLRELLFEFHNQEGGLSHSSKAVQCITGQNPKNVSQETERKRALSMVLSQTKHQEWKDADVLAEAKRIAESRMAAWGAEEPDLPVTSDIGPESAERAIGHGDTICPSNTQVPTAAVAPSTSIMADNASTLNIWSSVFSILSLH